MQITYHDVFRAWVNQPSKQQPFHEYHGMLVIAVPEDENHCCIFPVSGPYPQDGDIISMRCPNLCLSPGWPDHLRLKSVSSE